MKASTPARDSKDDLANDPTGRHGDVDRNGDLVDELASRLPMAELARDLPARDRAELRNRAARILLGLEEAPAQPSAAIDPEAPPPTPAPDESTPRIAAELRRHMPDESPIDLDQHARMIASVAARAHKRERARPWTVTP